MIFFDEHLFSFSGSHDLQVLPPVSASKIIFCVFTYISLFPCLSTAKFARMLQNFEINAILMDKIITQLKLRENEGV
jgi:hypothetical protein